MYEFKVLTWNKFMTSIDVITARIRKKVARDPGEAFKKFIT